jgi:nicotinate-nucleotide adenylyltransferase
MLSLAIAGHLAFRIDEIERDRKGPSYTADTLEHLHQMQHLHQMHPDDTWHLILGSDTLADLPRWHEPWRIIARASLLITARPGAPLASLDKLREALSLPPSGELRGRIVETPLIDISSRDLRRRAAQERSLRFLVPRSVECYIQEKRLYH